MPDEERIKEILREDARPDAQVTEDQLSEVAKEIVDRGEISPQVLEDVAEQVTGDPRTFLKESLDMGDIKNELDRPGRQ